MGNYQRIAPSDNSERYLKLLGGQKMFGSVMKVSHRVEIINDKERKALAYKGGAKGTPQKPGDISLNVTQENVNL